MELGTDEFIANVNNIGIAVVGQTSGGAPADKLLYSLRDVTATVNSIPLIAASIMSKKLAAGSDGIVLDVKTGKGAFMTEIDDAVRLASAMIDIGRLSGKKMNAVISDMNQPLGYAVGNKLEVREAILTLTGKRQGDLLAICLELGSLMLMQAGRCRNTREARDLLSGQITNGQALLKLKELVTAQGGDPSPVDDPDRLLDAAIKFEVCSEKEGLIGSCDAMAIGKASFVLGAGREKKEDVIDLGAGVLITRKAGDQVQKGEVLATLFTSRKEKIAQAEALVRSAYTMTESAPELILVHRIL